MFSNTGKINAGKNGCIQLLRLLVEGNNLDFGDVYGVFIAHFRTWDFLNGEMYSEIETSDFQRLQEDGALPDSMFLEERKTTAFIDASTGTGGHFVSGPSALRPGAFGWNCLTAVDLEPNKVVGITIAWDNNMGFASTVSPLEIVSQHQGCDEDVRFYNSMVVLHNEASGERQYWKLKGKAPETLFIDTGGDGPVTMHILLLPTPPADYVDGRVRPTDEHVSPNPAYSYQYKIDILGQDDDDAIGDLVTNAAEKEFEIVKFEPATPGWWPVRCTCLNDPLDTQELGISCMEPSFRYGGEVRLVPLIPVPTGETLCFSGNSIVQVETIGQVPIGNLKIGDRVLVAKDTYEPIYSFGHRHESRMGHYLRIDTTDSSSGLSSIEISNAHMILVVSDDKQQKRWIPASLVQIGDVLTGSKGEAKVVTKISRIEREGLYAPFTPSGRIIVNDITASTFVAMQNHSNGDRLYVGNNWESPWTFQWLALKFESLHRFTCRVAPNVCQDETYTEDGISHWVSGPMLFISRFNMLQQEPSSSRPFLLLQMFGFALVVGILITLDLLLEFVLLFPLDNTPMVSSITNAAMMFVLGILAVATMRRSNNCRVQKGTRTNMSL